MDELGVTFSFGPLDALESLSKIYSAKQLSGIEVQRISAEMEKFYHLLKVQTYENKISRHDMLQELKKLDAEMSQWRDKCIQNPEEKSYKEIYLKCIDSKSLLISKIGDIRIGKDWGRNNEV